MGKHFFERPKDSLTYLGFDGWRLNSQFRISLLNMCAFNKVTLEAAAISADVDPELLDKFMAGADGQLEYHQMTALVRVFGIEDILLTVTPRYLDRPGVGDDDLTAKDRASIKAGTERYWSDYRKECNIDDFTVR